MEHLLGNQQVIFKFTADNIPVCQVAAGDCITITTMDCFANQLQTAEDTLEKMDWERVNPATGPIYVEGAHAGQVLKVHIKQIKVGSQGVMATGENEGVLGAHMQGLTSRIMPIKNDKVIFDDQVTIPIKPMIGVIGVAPLGEGVNCGTPGSHGGNMDNNMVAEGAVLYFPIYVEGALFALGDVHAVMGDGEIGVSGVEVQAEVTVELEIVDDLKLNNPVLVNQDAFSTIASDLTLDQAAEQATYDMAAILSERLDLSFPDISMLMSAVGSVQVCQVVDPLRTARFVMPQWVLSRYGFSWV